MTTMTSEVEQRRGHVPPELLDHWIPAGSGSDVLEELRDAHLDALAGLAGAREKRARSADRVDGARVDYRRAVSAAVEADTIVPDPPPELDTARVTAVRAAHNLIVARAAAGVVRVVERACRVLAESADELEPFLIRARSDRAHEVAHIDRAVAQSVRLLVAWTIPQVGNVDPEALTRVRAALAADLTAGGED